MRVAKKLLCALIVVAALCTMMATTAFAAESGNLWLNVTGEAQKRTTVVVCADTTVTNGMVELRYDSSKLTYDSVTVSEAYVSVFAVNADTEGVIKIAWVAPGAYETDGTGIALINVHFKGEAGDSLVTVSGNVYDVDGQLMDIINPLDTAALEAAIAKAEKLDKKDYTAESYAPVAEALTEAKAVLADSGATQEEVDAATKKLNDAMAGLVKGGDDSADTGDNIVPVLVVLLLSATAAVVLILVGKKKGWWGK